METNYYEVYNQSNVTLFDIRETPIEKNYPAWHRQWLIKRAFYTACWARLF